MQVIKIKYKSTATFLSGKMYDQLCLNLKGCLEQSI